MSMSADDARKRPRNGSAPLAPETRPGETSPASPSIWRALLKTLHHFFPDFMSWLHAMPDPRDVRFIVYPIAYELAAGLMMFLTRLGSRRQMRFSFQTPEVVASLNYLCGTDCASMLHPDTLAYLAKRMSEQGLLDLRTAMIQRLIRRKCFDKDRLLGRWLRVAIDGTGYLVFRKPHCQQCLVQKHEKKTVYLHPVLEAKLVTPSGLSLSIATEFMENAKPGASKQDCEHKAFQRLAQTLKRDYPQLRLCLLLDGLYACGPVFKLCRDYKWGYIITFKEGSAPAVFAEYERLKAAGAQAFPHTQDGVDQTYWWVHEVDFSGEKVHVLECQETDPKRSPTRFVWVTNLRVDPRTYLELANRGGRLRWKIENQGFNVQKTNGYEMEHAYSENPRALRIFYLLLQIAHILAQLMEKGLLAKDLADTIGGLRNVARLLWEDLRRGASNWEELERYLLTPIQIRFADTS
jgi:hypothetical protein